MAFVSGANSQPREELKDGFQQSFQSAVKRRSYSKQMNGRGLRGRVCCVKTGRR